MGNGLFDSTAIKDITCSRLCLHSWGGRSIGAYDGSFPYEHASWVDDPGRSCLQAQQGSLLDLQPTSPTSPTLQLQQTVCSSPWLQIRTSSLLNYRCLYNHTRSQTLPAVSARMALQLPRCLSTMWYPRLSHSTCGYVALSHFRAQKQLQTDCHANASLFRHEVRLGTFILVLLQPASCIVCVYACIVCGTYPPPPPPPPLGHSPALIACCEQEKTLFAAPCW